MRNLLPKAGRYVKCNNRKRLGWMLDRFPQLKTEASLLWEAWWSNRALVRWLLEQGISPDVPGCSGHTLLMQAASENDVGMVRLLLVHGADVNHRNEQGETAFSYCCANNSLASAQLLAEQGADINTVDKGNGSPLDWAVCWSAAEFREWLVSMGARRNDDTYEPWAWPRPNSDCSGHHYVVDSVIVKDDGSCQ